MVRADWRHDARLETPAGALGWDDVLEGYGKLSPAERAALPATAFVESLREAVELSERHTGLTFVTRRHEIVRGPVVRVAGASAEASGLFALRREEQTLAGRAAQARGGSRGRRAAPRGASGPASGPRGRASAPARGRARGAGPAPRLRRAARGADRGARPASPGERDPRLGARRALAGGSGPSDAARGPRRDRAAARRGRRRGAPPHRRRSPPLSRRRASPPRPAAEELAHRRTEAEVAAERRRAMEAARDTLAEARSTLERRLAEATEEETRMNARAAELVLEESEARARQTGNLGARETQALDHASAVETARETVERVGAAEAAARELRGTLDAAREARFEAEVTSTRAASDLEHLVDAVPGGVRDRARRPRAAGGRVAGGPRGARDRGRRAGRRRSSAWARSTCSPSKSTRRCPSG